MTSTTRPSRSWVDERDVYLQLAKSQTPYVILTTKDHWIWRCIATALWITSAGRMKRQTFLEDFATTFGPLQAYPRQWAAIPDWLIVHESRHTYQCERLGWMVPVLGWLDGRLRTWVGLAPMAVVYGCFPFPVLLAWGRMRLELDADAASWEASLQNGWQTPDEVRRRSARFSEMVAGPAYLWSWPREWTRLKFSKRAEEVIRSVQDVQA